MLSMRPVRGRSSLQLRISMFAFFISFLLYLSVLVSICMHVRDQSWADCSSFTALLGSLTPYAPDHSTLYIHLHSFIQTTQTTNPPSNRAHLLLRIHPPHSGQTPRRRFPRPQTQQTSTKPPPPPPNQRLRRQRTAPALRSARESRLRCDGELCGHAKPSTGRRR